VRNKLKEFLVHLVGNFVLFQSPNRVNRVYTLAIHQNRELHEVAVFFDHIANRRRVRKLSTFFLQNKKSQKKKTKKKKTSQL
jgi:hypothetical protein